MTFKKIFNYLFNYWVNNVHFSFYKRFVRIVHSCLGFDPGSCSCLCSHMQFLGCDFDFDSSCMS